MAGDDDLTLKVGLDTDGVPAEYERLMNQLSAEDEAWLNQRGAIGGAERAPDMQKETLRDRIEKAVRGAWRDAVFRLNDITGSIRLGRGKDVPENPEYEYERQYTSNSSRIDRFIEEQDVQSSREIPANKYKDIPIEEFTEGKSTWELMSDDEREQLSRRAHRDMEPADTADFGAADTSSRMSQAGSDAYARFRLMDERSSARQEYRLASKFGNEGQAMDAAERYARADAALKADRGYRQTGRTDEKQEEITEELKEQGHEYTDQIMKIGKVFAILGAIKGVLDAIKKLGKITIEVVKNITGNTVDEYGSLTADTRGSSRAQSDKTYAVMSEGLRNLGNDTPLTPDAYRNGLERINDIRQKALTGRVDKQVAIAFQFVNDHMGTGFDARQLLAGDPTRSNAEIYNEFAKAVEKALSSADFWSQDDLTREQTLGFLKETFGPELVNAIMYNISANKTTGETKTLVERAMDAGTNAASNDDTISNVRRINNAFAELRDSVSALRKTFVDTFEPAIVSVTGWLQGLVDWIKDLLGKNEKENREERKEVYKTETDQRAQSMEKIRKLHEDKVLSTDTVPGVSSWVGSREDKDEMGGWKHRVSAEYLAEDAAKAKDVGDLYNRMVSRISGTNSNFEFMNLHYGEYAVEEELLKRMVGKSLWTVDRNGRKEKTKYGDEFLDDLADTMREEFKGTAGDDAVREFTLSDYKAFLESTKAGRKVYEKHFGQGGSKDFDPNKGENGPDFAGYLNDALGAEGALAFMLNRLLYDRGIQGGSQVQESKIDIDEVKGDVTLRVIFNNQDGKAGTVTFPISNKAAQQAELVTLIGSE